MKRARSCAEERANFLEFFGCFGYESATTTTTTNSGSVGERVHQRLQVERATEEKVEDIGSTGGGNAGVVEREKEREALRRRGHPRQPLSVSNVDPGRHLQVDNYILYERSAGAQ